MASVMDGDEETPVIKDTKVMHIYRRFFQGFVDLIRLFYILCWKK